MSRRRLRPTTVLYCAESYGKRKATQQSVLTTDNTSYRSGAVSSNQTSLNFDPPYLGQLKSLTHA